MPDQFPLATQFLLHLMQSNDTNNESASTAMTSSAPLNDWNVVILPLIFGKTGTTSESDKNPSLFLWNDTLRGELLNLSSFSSKRNNSSIVQVKTTAELCLRALDHFASSKEATALCSKKIAVVCQVLIRFHDNVARGERTGEEEEIVQDDIHRAVLTILRGICYTEEDADGGEAHRPRPPLLSLENLRPITGMLLPKLSYAQHHGPQEGKRRNGGEVKVDERAFELWRELLLLLPPYSNSLMDENEGGGKRRRCKNWYAVFQFPLSQRVNNLFFLMLEPRPLDSILPQELRGAHGSHRYALHFTAQFPRNGTARQQRCPLPTNISTGLVEAHSRLSRTVRQFK